MTEEERDRVAELFNEIFHLQLDWTSVAQGAKVEPVKSKELDRLGALLPELKAKLLHEALMRTVWLLTQNRDLLQLVAQRPETMRSLFGDEAPVQRMADALRRGSIIDIDGPFKNWLFQQPPHAASGADAIARVLEIFFEVESEILRGAGLDQASVSTVMHFLEKHKAAIARNLKDRKVLYPKKIIASLDTVEKDLGTMRSMRKTSDGFVSTKLIRRVRKKVVALATIWADAVPVLLAHDWGVAGVLSCTAGATVGAMMPSSDHEIGR